VVEVEKVVVAVEEVVMEEVVVAVEEVPHFRALALWVIISGKERG
jgi:hypothetical protein